ncbi:host-nuclease inhibitor Gam family protein [Oceanobacillus kimchii]|uniref:Bacteriophage Mu Gam like protein n=1 Tax=Oceanobacillus kimchii TaxID=746691 RepID=A0ABQ5TMD6_9BACI|nr:host-nuclease inhibitor Gam family protein [Oceanobacillus kimchii]GLO66280.1 hypothetical protein MACH08_20640 [Oceanobacillus kimchii]
MSEENNNVEENVAELELWKVDAMIEDLKNNNEHIEKLNEIYNQRVAELKKLLDEKVEKITKDNHFIKTTLSTYAKSSQDVKETKTQFKLPLLSGNIIVKKGKRTLNAPKKDNEAKLISLYPDFVEKVTTDKFKWSDLKSKLEIVEDRVFDTESGEDITDAVNLVEKPEEIEIK